MRNIQRSGPAGRARRLGAARPTCVLVAVVFTLALRPASGVAQVSFVMAEHAGSLSGSTADPTRALVLPGSESLAGVWGWRLGVSVELVGTVAAPPTTAEVNRLAAASGSPLTGETGTPAEAVPALTGAALIAEQMVETAARYVGTRYRWGGDAPGEGFDCSGFVRYVYAQQGIELPRVSRAQARAGRALPARLDDLQPGDLLFFAQRGAGIDHVALYAGDNRIVHASRRGYGVRYDELTGEGGRWYAQHLVAVRRVIDDIVIPSPDESEEPALPLGEPLEVLVADQGDEAAAVPAL